jgi:HEAT repeat protein
VNLEKCIQEFMDDTRPIKHSLLANLSDLTGEELHRLKDIWPVLSSERRLKILEQLDNLADDNIELNFTQIFRMALADSEGESRAKAIDALWECTDRSLILPLINMLKTDTFENVRAACAITLGNFAILAQDGKILLRDSITIQDALLHTASDAREMTEVRRRAVEAVSAFPGHRVAEIIQMAYESESVSLRCSAVYAMGNNSDDQWIPIIIKELSSEIPEIQYEAVNASAKACDEEAVSHLGILINQNDLEIQLSAIHALGSIGGSIAKRLLQECLNSSQEEVQDTAQNALNNLDSDDTL